MKIDIIGTGNVGTHLAEALLKKADVNRVSSRSLENIRTDSDIYLVCVSDDAIEDVSARVATHISSYAVLAHTSGTTPLSAIGNIHRSTGVFYPLQTFSKDVELAYDDIPFFIEGSDTGARDRLEEAARMVSRTVYHADSETRRDLHIASVLSCNFVNHLWALASEYLSKKNIPFDALLPLINETTRKIHRICPQEAQTGPAVRHDVKTVERHMSRISDDPELTAIYRILTESIMLHHKQ